MNRQTAIIENEEDGHFLDNLEISEEIETKKEKEKGEKEKEKKEKEKGKEKKIKKEKGKENEKESEKDNKIENKKEIQFKKRITGNITNENNTERDSLNQENNLNNNGIYNVITENINERKDDSLDLGKSHSSNMKKKRK